MGLPGWVPAIIVGFIFVIASVVFGDFSQTENDLIERVSDILMIFGIIIIIITVVIIGFALRSR